MSEFKDYVGILSVKGDFTDSALDVITITGSGNVRELWVDGTGNLTGFTEITGSITSVTKPANGLTQFDTDPHGLDTSGFVNGWTLRDLIVGTPAYPAQITFEQQFLTIDGHSVITAAGHETFSNVAASFF